MIEIQYSYTQYVLHIYKITHTNWPCIQSRWSSSSVLTNLGLVFSNLLAVEEVLTWLLCVRFQCALNTLCDEKSFRLELCTIWWWWCVEKLRCLLFLSERFGAYCLSYTSDEADRLKPTSLSLSLSAAAIVQQQHKKRSRKDTSFTSFLVCVCVCGW